MTRRRRNRQGRHRPHASHLQAVPPSRGAQTPLSRALEADCWTAQWLAERVEAFGGIEAYEALDDTPVPDDEPFDWSAVEPDDEAVVTSILATFDRFMSEPAWKRRWRAEYVTILHRLLAKAARQPAGTIRRRTSPDRIAAALAWIALRGNGELGRRRGQWSADLLWWDLGVTDCAALGRSIASELGMLEEQPSAPRQQRWLVQLHDPALMRGFRRGWEAETRDDAIERIEQEVQRQADEAVMQITPEGFTLRAREAELSMCVPAIGSDGEPLVAIALGADPVEPDEAFSLSMADGRRLLESLQRALWTNERRSS